MRDENDFVERKKDGDGREGVGDKKKNGKRIENQWEMKYIRTPGARSTGYDLSRHTVVPHWAGGSGRDGERGGRQGEGGGEGEKEPLRRETRAGGETDIQLFFWGATVHLSKTATHSKPVFVHKAPSAATTSSGHALCWCWHNKVRYKMWALIFLQSTLFLR